jgi:glycosyltransferase involved in cell wall biosynthesis
MSAPFFSLIIPVYNAAYPFEICLQSVASTTFADCELVVVDDHSTDGSAGVARHYGARLLATSRRSGPAAARNLGATVATGRYLFFLDADCQLHPDTLAQAAAILQADPGLDALFGSYDDAPAAPNFISQYKNLFHHYIHQTSKADAATFWTGCGAIKRTTFSALGGFDARRYPRASIEDIELGYRLKQAGGRIRLAREVQVKHLKRWTLPGLLHSDVHDRAIPWTRLLLQQRELPADLNLQLAHRLSVPTVYLALFSALTFPYWRKTSWLLFLSSVLLLGLNGDLYRFFARKRGFLFALAAIPFHWLYYLYGSLAAVWSALEQLLRFL